MRKESNFSMHSLCFLIITLSLYFHGCFAGLLSEPAQPLKPGDYPSNSNTVPAFPVQTQAQTCRLDLSTELFGGVSAACGSNLDRSRCCPVLAAWLFAAHARSALQVPSAAPPASPDMPMMPDDSQKCVNSLQNSLQSRNIHIPQPNASCDAVLCFCGIRLHQITSLSCPAAFNISGNYRNATPTAAVRNLEHHCKNSSYAGCTRCLGALQKLTGDGKNRTKELDSENSDRASKMLSRDCQMMGLTWLLARNKTAYIPTVSAVLRAIMYSAHPPHESKCSPDQENMPLAVDSPQFEKYDSSASRLASTTFPIASILIPLLPLIILGYLFV
ncbi:putative GPI-anchored protein [Forsythia ovata]|uniref:GPI-anchored protein n=1 Tax=Forsythia ovata TaxID=205694 RepID=A0ABD1R4A8_9LAMI